MLLKQLSKRLKHSYTVSLILIFSFHLILSFSSDIQAKKYLGSDSLQADKEKDISGTIKDAVTGETLVYANVIIEESNYGATTNKGGFSVIVDAPAELCTLLVSYMGYESKRISYDNTKADNKKLDVQLANFHCY